MTIGVLCFGLSEGFRGKFFAFAVSQLMGDPPTKDERTSVSTALVALTLCKENGFRTPCSRGGGEPLPVVLFEPNRIVRSAMRLESATAVTFESLAEIRPSLWWLMTDSDYFRVQD